MGAGEGKDGARRDETRRLWESYLRLTRPAHGLIIRGMIMSALSTLFALVPYFMAITIARSAMARDLPSAFSLALMVGAAIACAAIARFLFGAGTGVCHQADALFRVNARHLLVEHFSRLPLGWFLRRSSSEVKQAVSDDVLGMHPSVGHAPSEFVNALLTPLVPLAYLFTVDWRLSLGLLAYLVLLMVISTVFMMRDYAKTSARYDKANVELSAAAVEMTEGIEVVKAFGGTRRANDRFRAAVQELTDVTYEWTKLTAGPFSLLTSLISPGVVLALLAGASYALIVWGWSDFAGCLPFLVLGPSIPSGLVTVGMSMGFLRMARQGLAHIAGILGERPLPEPAHPVKLGGDDLDVSFEGVSFSYEKDLPLVLKDVDARLEPGSVCALVGDSGSGKTTFARLIPRFWDPVFGVVALTGVSLREALSRDVLSKVTIVFQESMLLSVSVRDNIRLARPGAFDSEVEEAARRAQIHDRILELPEGYDTVIGSKGAALSGGEAQRIAVARAIIQDAPILVLDEATAHADPENELAIQTALADLVRGRTTVVIAHRLDTVAHADQILVLEGGRIVESGRHGELLDAGGRYAALWEAQQVNTGPHLGGREVAGQ